MVHTINSLYPAIKSVTFVSASLVHFPCAIAELFLFQALQYLPVASNTHAEHLPLFITASYDYPFPFPFGAIGRPLCRRNTTHLVHVMTRILPPSFFVKTVHFVPAFGITVYGSFQFFTLLSTLHDQPCIASRCLLAAAALSYPSSKHVISTGLHRLLVVLELFFLPHCGAELPLCLAYTFLFFSFPFFAFICYLPPSAISFITIHELVTKTKQQCDDFFFAYF